MSLVAYDESSDEDSSFDEEKKEERNSTNPVLITTQSQERISPSKTPCLISAPNGHISDEDEDLNSAKINPQCSNKKPALSLPPPKTTTNFKSLTEELVENVTPTFAKLPIPKLCPSGKLREIEEEDDEFLHKKALPLNNEEFEKPPPPKTAALSKARVKITIPSLNEFADVDKDLADRTKIKNESFNAPKGSSLLSMLPKAKSEQDFSKSTNIPRSNTSQARTTRTTVFIPDSVKNQRPAKNTENVDGIQTKEKKPPIKPEKPKLSLVDCSDSESDNEIDSSKDFFSLNAAEELPEVSSNEIKLMVEKRAAEMAEATSKYLNSATTEENEEMDKNGNDIVLESAKRPNSHQNLDTEAMHALIGEGNAKRRRGQHGDIQIMDISGEEVLPNREDWLRTTLASSTAYQPTGVIVDEEPASGTRRKHQITYLAHKAKANEAELQAMWAANRHTRRVTQSKYGF